jgi:hypothetical protein
MKDKREKSTDCAKKIDLPKDTVEKQSDDYCIINGQKIEGNACSTILDNQ